MNPVVRSQLPFTLAFVLTVISAEGRAQLSSRENAGTVYRHYNNGIPDSMFTWLESDVHVVPEYPGGPGALAEYFRTDQACAPATSDTRCHRESEITLFVVVECDGSVEEAQVYRGGCPSSQERAVCSALHMPRWSPGSRYGQAVRTRVRVPVRYGE